MSINNKTSLKEKSSKKVARFLKENKVHKKDFAQMIGVTLSYVYNLIDENIPFSTRGVTLERIATVMDIIPEEFEEYLIRNESGAYNKNIEKIKEQLKHKNISTIDFLKHFERKKRLNIVDMLRGQKPISANFYELQELLRITGMKNREIFAIWCDLITEYLDSFGFNSEQNLKLLHAMLNSAKKILCNSSDNC